MWLMVRNMTKNLQIGKGKKGHVTYLEPAPTESIEYLQLNV